MHLNIKHGLYVFSLFAILSQSKMSLSEGMCIHKKLNLFLNCTHELKYLQDMLRIPCLYLVRVQVPKFWFSFCHPFHQNQENRVIRTKSTALPFLFCPTEKEEESFLRFYIISALFLVNVTILLESLTFSHLLNLN